MADITLAPRLLVGATMHQPGERDLLHEGWPNGRQGDVHLRQHGKRHRGECQRETARKVFQCQTGQDYF